MKTSRHRNSDGTDTRQTEVEAFCAASASARLMDENKEEDDTLLVLLISVNLSYVHCSRGCASASDVDELADNDSDRHYSRRWHSQE